MLQLWKFLRAEPRYSYVVKSNDSTARVSLILLVENRGRPWVPLVAKASEARF